MWENSLIEALQKMSNAFTDALFLGLTYLGDEMFFIVVAALIFWCVDKKYGYKFLTVYIFGAAINDCIKLLVKRPRPYTIAGIESIGAKTEGYSFPSGHSQSIANISTQLSMRYGKKGWWVYFAAAATVLTVMFSRMFLGQHYLTDVLAGAALGVAVAVGFSLLFELLKDKEHWLFVGLVPVLVVLCIVLGEKNILTVGGAVTAFSIGYFLEKKYIGFSVSGRWWHQVIKFIVGIAVALGLKEGLKPLLPSDILWLSVFLRYFLIGIWASLGAPAVFRFFPILWAKICKKLGKKSDQNNSNTDSQNDQTQEADYEQSKQVDNEQGQEE